jgi:aspartyl-tRNA(Asn)/glutamyl-tRNA(Gln) amidotransferase subunit B
MWLPGALPQLSYECVIKAAALGKLIGCHQQEISYFDRKSYFYPDLPLWYQITQFSRPLNINGEMSYYNADYTQKKTIQISQAHLECDTAKTAYIEGQIMLDYNRALTPLIEVVTTPDFHDTDDVIAFLKELQRTLQYYNISEGQMDKGQMRCDVNISLSTSDALGTKVEIKNMNSLSAIKKAIEYEYTRQSEILDQWLTLPQETRWWDETTGASYTLRSKENAIDYRYFPEPDLPPLHFTAAMDHETTALIGETLTEKIDRYTQKYGFHKEYINGILSDKSITKLFESCLAQWCDPMLVSKYLVNHVLASISTGNMTLAQTPFSEDAFMTFIMAVQEKKLSDHHAKQVINSYIATRWDMTALISEATSTVVDTSVLDSIIEEVLRTHAHVVAEYHGGKVTTIGFLIGQVMKQTKWAASPQEVQQALEKKLLQS